MFHDKVELTLPHLQPDAGCIKNSAYVMHNGRVNTNNKTTSYMLVRRNLASHLQGASLCRAELIPTEEQIWAATMQDARTFLSTTMEGEGFHATAEEVHATRTKEEEMVQELLNGW